jgi:hypothetical protein
VDGEEPRGRSAAYRSTLVAQASSTEVRGTLISALAWYSSFLPHVYCVYWLLGGAGIKSYHRMPHRQCVYKLDGEQCHCTTDLCDPLYSDTRRGSGFDISSQQLREGTRTGRCFAIPPGRERRTSLLLQCGFSDQEISARVGISLLKEGASDDTFSFCCFI